MAALDKEHPQYSEGGSRAPKMADHTVPVNRPLASFFFGVLFRMRTVLVSGRSQPRALHDAIPTLSGRELESIEPIQLSVLLAVILLPPQMAQHPRSPDVEAQRAAMKKLDFLVGRWTGDARISRGAGDTTELLQTEEAGYKLDGLVLLIEGTGRRKSDGAPVLQALGVVTYDDEHKAYRMRAFNDGRFLETEVKLLEQGTGMTWGFALGEITTNSVMRINDKGEWTETHEISINSQPPRRLMDVAVHREK